MKNKTTKRVLDLNQNKIMKNSRNLFQMGVFVLLVILLVVGLTGCESRRDPSTIAKNTPANTQTASQDQTKTPTLSSTPTQMQQPTQELGIGSEMINPKDNAEMVYVPAGEFLMGSDDSDASDIEVPKHTVYVDSFWMYKHEVTNAQFAAFLNAEGIQQEGGVPWWGTGDLDAPIHQSAGKWVEESSYANHPVVEVTWYGAAAYCEWAGGRLPTEAEWEKTARGTDGRKYPWGEEEPNCNLAQFSDCEGWTVPVGSPPEGASPYGALNMAGNVSEWVSDWYDEAYYDQAGNNDNPQGPLRGSERVNRGGSFIYPEEGMRISNRGVSGPDLTNGIDIGFRCVFDEADDLTSIAEEIQPEETITESSLNEVDGAEMVFVPAGEFLMGSEDTIAFDHEAPEHMVYVDDFWMYKHEVTNAQFADFLNAKGNQVEGEMTWLDAYDVHVHVFQSEGWWIPDTGYKNHPVVEVNWYGAAAYCEWAGGHLPTEAEWEKAARGTDGRTYPWGNDDVTGTKANYCDKNCPGEWAVSYQDDGYSRTAPVGSFPDGVSPYGILDLAGNVWEWVADWLDVDYYSQSGSTYNPQGPPNGDYKILRGGSWSDVDCDLRSTFRGGISLDYTGDAAGFRCVFDEETQPEETITGSLKNEVDGAEIVLVPRGEFLMGSEDSDAKLNEAPQHMVFMDSFWVYKHEVTNAQFAAFLSAEGNKMEGDVTWLDVDGVDVHIHQSEEQWVPDASYEEHPVVHVSWFGAAAYCQWAGGHLPTEAEWEKAARGADGRTYPWGYDAVTGAKANYCDKNCPKDRADMNQDDGYSLTAPVGSFPDGASHYGALDLAGNVWEWVADWYDGDYYSQPGNTDNPQGPPDGDYKIMRGGSWDREENLLRSSYRGVVSLDGSYFNTGFRCVLDQND